MVPPPGNGEDAGSGLDNVSAAELRIPFLTQLQGLSPQVKLQTAVVTASQSGVDASQLDALLGKAISSMTDAEATATLDAVEKLVAAVKAKAGK